VGPLAPLLLADSCLVLLLALGRRAPSHGVEELFTDDLRVDRPADGRNRAARKSVARRVQPASGAILWRRRAVNPTTTTSFMFMHAFLFCMRKSWCTT